jgi:M6 family metalloprotease-like protein
LRTLHRYLPPACARLLSIPLLAAILAAGLSVAPAVAGPAPPAHAEREGQVLVAAEPEGMAVLGQRQREALGALLDAAPGPGARAGRQEISWLGILVEFADRQFPENYEESFDPLGVLGIPDSLITTPRADWFRNLMDRTADYYATVSRGAVTLLPTLTDSVLALSGDMVDYGDDETLSWEQGARLLASEVVDSLDAELDFSAYDLITFIHAGPGQESDLLQNSPEQLWSGYLDFESLSEAFADSLPAEPPEGWPGIITDDMGFVLRQFGIAPELEREEEMDPPFVLGALGVYAHQLGSYLGLLSLGDYQSPRGQGVGNYDLMGSGLWNALGFVPGPPCAFNRYVMGWADTLHVDPASCVSVETDGGRALELVSWEQAGEDDLLFLPISDREYFLMENRDQDADGNGAFSFDDANGNHIPDNGESLLGAEFDYYTTQYNSSDVTPGSGLFIWRIDEEMLRLTFDYDINLINAYNDHYGVMLLEADGYPDLSTASNYDENAYGGDYDAFRAEGGPNDLMETGTAADASTLPNTRTAEGVDSGWRFHSVGAHGPTMSFTARWEAQGFPRSEEHLAGRLPVGDPLAADVIGDAALEFVYLTTDGDSLFVHVAPSGDFAAASVIARIEGQAAGALAAGNLGGTDKDEIVLHTMDGGIFAWGGTGVSVGGAPDEPMAQVDSILTAPLLAPVSGPALLAVEFISDDGDTGYDQCIPRWYDESGTTFPMFDEGALWGVAYRGRPVGAAAISRAVSLAGRGYDHPEPHLLFANLCLTDDSVEGGSLRILQIPAIGMLESGAEPAVLELPLTPGFDANVQLTAADLDGDGIDEIMIESEGQLLLWYPAGRFGGDGAGETLFRGDLLAASSGQALLPSDLNGDGVLEAITASSSALAAYGPEGSGLDGWIHDIPQTDPAPELWRDPSHWLLSLRDDEGRDKPLLLTLDGRLFAGHADLSAGLPSDFIGGDLSGSPVLADFDGDGLLELRGLTGFEPALATTAGEDTLLTGAVTRHWQLKTDWPVGAPGAWIQGGADAARTRRVAASAVFTPPSAGTGGFRAAYAYPNPAADSVTWRVETDAPDQISVELYDLEGQRRLSLEGVTDGFSPWEGESRLEGLASGVYFYVIRSENTGGLETGRLAILR